MKLSDIHLHDVGNTIQLVGAVYGDGDKMLLCLFPEDRGQFFDAQEGVAIEHVWFEEPGAGQDPLHKRVHVLDMDPADWEKFLRQTDLLETEILTKASDGTLAKAVVRKCQRQIDSGTQWKVFKRDNYTCRYCGNDDCPLTVDHLVLWEEGGPSTTDNMVAACKKCNKVRGNMQYEDWLRHPRYKDLSRKLTPEVRAANEELIGKIRFIPRVVNQRSR